MTFDEFKRKVAEKKVELDDVFKPKQRPRIHDKDVPHDYIMEYHYLEGQSVMIDKIVDWLADVKDTSGRELPGNRKRG